MQPATIFSFRSAALFLVALTIVLACNKSDEDVLPITNDLRVLQVRTEGNTVTSGEDGYSVISNIQLIFSHGLNTSAFEGALSLSPEPDFTIEYDESKSFATFVFNTPLEYETTYTLKLPGGAYGNGGEELKDDFEFIFTTAAFEPPALSLSASETSFFEGETITITATLDRAILEEVSLDLEFAGTAGG
ncbi:MAG: Ig-like domain-containing protein, partial [Phaeodactylibacter sp.]|nr:Ig-like domain-containing protein [Phaeodactylibacter sp.]